VIRISHVFVRPLHGAGRSLARPSAVLVAGISGSDSAIGADRADVFILYNAGRCGCATAETSGPDRRSVARYRRPSRARSPELGAARRGRGRVVSANFSNPRSRFNRGLANQRTRHAGPATGGIGGSHDDCCRRVRRHPSPVDRQRPADGIAVGAEARSCQAPPTSRRRGCPGCCCQMRHQQHYAISPR